MLYSGEVFDFRHICSLPTHHTLATIQNTSAITQHHTKTFRTP